MFLTSFVQKSKSREFIQDLVRFVGAMIVISSVMIDHVTETANYTSAAYILGGVAIVGGLMLLWVNLCVTERKLRQAVKGVYWTVIGLGLATGAILHLGIMLALILPIFYPPGEVGVEEDDGQEDDETR